MMFKKFLLAESEDLNFHVEVEKTYKTCLDELDTYLCDDRTKLGNWVAEGKAEMADSGLASCVRKFNALTEEEKPKISALDSFRGILKRWG